MKRNRQTKGFTLIELMVVILILGLLAGVIGLAVADVMDKNKAKLDAESLTKFASGLQLAMEDPANSRTIRKESDEASSAWEVFKLLYERQVVNHDLMTRLAAASGAAGDEDEYKMSDAEVYTKEFCIFTGPDTVQDLKKYLSGNKKDHGIVLCYNENFINKYPEYGCVIVDAGTTKAEVRPWEQFQDYYENVKIPPGDKTGVYGEVPFQNVVSK